MTKQDAVVSVATAVAVAAAIFLGFQIVLSILTTPYTWIAAGLIMQHALVTALPGTSFHYHRDEAGETRFVLRIVMAISGTVSIVTLIYMLFQYDLEGVWYRVLVVGCFAYVINGVCLVQDRDLGWDQHTNHMTPGDWFAIFAIVTANASMLLVVARLIITATQLHAGPG